MGRAGLASDLCESSIGAGFGATIWLLENPLGHEVSQFTIGEAQNLLVDRWEDIYQSFTQRLIEAVPIQRLTLGGVCIYREARRLMEQKMGLDNAISVHIDDGFQKAGDGRMRYPRELRHRAYSLIIEAARRLRPDLELALCLEENALWQSTGLVERLGRCNCVL